MQERNRCSQGKVGGGGGGLEGRRLWIVRLKLATFYDKLWQDTYNYFFWKLLIIINTLHIHVTCMCYYVQLYIVWWGAR